MPERSNADLQTAQAGRSPEQAGEPYVLKLTEQILGTSDAIGASEQLDVASILYTSVATIIGSLCGACLYPLFPGLTPEHPVTWLAFLLGAVTLGGLAGFAIVAIVFNARGYTRWQRKYRPDERPRR